MPLNLGYFLHLLGDSAHTVLDLPGAYLLLGRCLRLIREDEARQEAPPALADEVCRLQLPTPQLLKAVPHAADHILLHIRGDLGQGTVPRLCGSRGGLEVEAERIAFILGGFGHLSVGVGKGEVPDLPGSSAFLHQASGHEGEGIGAVGMAVQQVIFRIGNKAEEDRLGFRLALRRRRSFVRRAA